MNTYDYLRRELVTLRKKHNITQKQLAKDTGISQSLISKYEKGLNDLSITKYFTIKEYLESLDTPQTIEQYATFNVFSATSNTTVEEIKTIMLQKNYSQIPIIDNDGNNESLTGSIMLSSLIDAQPHTLLKELLEEPFPLLPLQTSVEVAKKLLKEKGCSAILTKKGSTFGIITSADLI